MEFMRIGPKGSETPVVVENGTSYSLAGIVADIDPDFWSEGPARVAQALAAGELTAVNPAGQRIGAPVARPSAIICIGQNYAAHAAESGAQPPTHPIVFLKTPNTLTGPYDAVGIPPASEKTDWEVELAIVIGKPAAYLQSDAEAADAIGGYMTVNDLSERSYQMDVSGGQWSKGKCVKDFLPAGPVLRTADSIDPADLRLRSWVNGEPRQDSSTRDMIFSVTDIVRDLSQYMQLEPGDIICTGTPEGVAFSGRFPYLQAGDVTEIEIEGLGKQRQEYHRIEAGK
ncbi:fumarylacetoacetate hydrolase family protein [Arthrobacter sp. zg-Y1219]|uniref:fumarylacetoacetate hydrolase family protein n=1 Tax=Arthrobacter sp. zg-Y1219 TaxID=3049067 RepID=UPI0024C2849E|nr:fumarylacetoacetate hydrolase family protein [Arthrobacter sp. zg-Y1219]MDK1361283.1 fumarylacetoacetate hydrolase family protein [Arthrobacter sp. zg-Y1219]